MVYPSSLISTLPLRLPHFFLSPNLFSKPIDILINIKATDPIIGLELHVDAYNKRLMLKSWIPNTPSVRIPHYRSSLHDSTLIDINGTPVDSIGEVTKSVQDARATKDNSVTVTLIQVEHITTQLNNNIPTLCSTECHSLSTPNYNEQHHSLVRPIEFFTSLRYN